MWLRVGCGWMVKWLKVRRVAVVCWFCFLLAELCRRRRKCSWLRAVAESWRCDDLVFLCSILMAFRWISDFFGCVCDLIKKLFLLKKLKGEREGERDCGRE